MLSAKMIRFILRVVLSKIGSDFVDVFDFVERPASLSIPSHHD